MGGSGGYLIGDLMQAGKWVVQVDMLLEYLVQAGKWCRQISDQIYD